MQTRRSFANARALFGATAAVALAQPAHADNLFDGDQLRGFLDLSPAVTDGETSWLEEGFGKLRFSGDNGDWDADVLARGMLIWTSHLSWNVDALVTVQADSQMQQPLDIVEAFLSYRGAPSAGWRFSGRAGVFFPPVSLEHDGPGWTTTDTLTPSAVNSWIGEEVKVLGVEATAARPIWGRDFSATAALFGYNDTSGTLIAFRGWALGDVTPGVFGELDLPTRSYPYQDYTRATMELDNRLGWYARLQYRPLGNITLEALYYDNNGDAVSDAHGQTDWETTFTNVGLRAALGDDMRLRAQAMYGHTIWGYNVPGFGYYTDVDYGAAYVLLARDFGPHTIAGRIDYFDVSDNSFVAVDNNDEEGWAATAAYQVEVNDHSDFGIEAVHVASDRPSRTDQGLAPEQDQTSIRTTVRVHF